DRVWLDLPLALGGYKIARPGDGYQLSVSGKIICTEAWVRPTGDWPDYVFSSEYKLPSLSSVEQFIKTNSHLPEVPSAAEIEEKGQNVGEMNAILLKKVEEMTLYIIQANKDIQQSNQEMIKVRQ